MQPAVAGRHLGGEDRLARDDEAGRPKALRPDPAGRGAHQHGWPFSAGPPRESLRQVGAVLALRLGGSLELLDLQNAPLPFDAVASTAALRARRPVISRVSGVVSVGTRHSDPGTPLSQSPPGGEWLNQPDREPLMRSEGRRAPASSVPHGLGRTQPLRWNTQDEEEATSRFSMRALSVTARRTGSSLMLRARLAPGMFI